MGPSTPAYKATATRPADCGARRESDPLVMLYSDDLEATAEAVTEGGGTIVEPMRRIRADAASSSPTLTEPARRLTSG